MTIPVLGMSDCFPAGHAALESIRLSYEPLTR